MPYQLLYIPVRAEIAAFGPIRLARGQPDDKARGQIGAVGEIGVQFLGHVPPQLGGHAARMDGEAFDAVFTVIHVDEFAFRETPRPRR